MPAGQGRRARLDVELVRRGLTPTREHAAAAIAAGRVRVAGQPAHKAATGVAAGTALTLDPADRHSDYASRGGHKLAAAVAEFGSAEPPLRVAGRRCLDAGASTGGFTDVLLRNGAAEVWAVDVGYGQLVWRLRTDPHVHVLDRTNVRELDPAMLGGPVDLVTADLSFIGLPVVLPALCACVRADGDMVLLVKPQFEVGRDQLGRGGVVRDPQQRVEAVEAVAAAGTDRGLGVRGVVASPLPGPAGNVEYLLWLAPGEGPGPATVRQWVHRAVEAGPQ